MTASKFNASRRRFKVSSHVPTSVQANSLSPLNCDGVPARRHT